MKMELQIPFLLTLLASWSCANDPSGMPMPDAALDASESFDADTDASDASSSDGGLSADSGSLGAADAGLVERDSADDATPRPLLGVGECRPSEWDTTTCASSAPYLYICSPGAPADMPDATCEGTPVPLPTGTSWCCPEPWCTRDTAGDTSCNAGYPRAFRCPPDAQVPAGCSAIGGDSSQVCCPE